MSVCALMVVQDEADVVGHALDWLAAQGAAEALVHDRASSDGTREILEEHPLATVVAVEAGAYRQDERTTEMAELARGRGHEWGLPCDADECWAVYGRPGDTLAGFLAASEGEACCGDSFVHVPTAQDGPASEGPFRRMPWRRARPQWRKVAPRLRPGVALITGAHAASRDGAELPLAGGLVVHHFPYRDADQFVRAARKRWETWSASAAMQERREGLHWRDHGHVLLGTAHPRLLASTGRQGEDGLRDLFAERHYSSDPAADRLVHDPLP